MQQMNLLAAKVDQDAATRLTGAFLAQLEDGGWHKGRELAARLRTNERVLRQIASDSSGAVLSGQRGYRLTKSATIEEIDHAERWLLSQARHMTDRARQIRIARNRSGVAA
ncbi:MAG: hypothetical protein RLY20_2483 [Verrucomicrobiota bacterium]|jgi:hypothetical protein